MSRKIQAIRTIPRWFWLAVPAVTIALAACGPVPTPTPIPPSPFDIQYGIANINPAQEYDETANSQNITRAQELGTQWDRWVIQWFWIDQPWQYDDFIWSGQFDLNGDQFDVDAASVAAGDMASSSIDTLIVLHGVPRKYDCVADPPPADPPDYEIYTQCDITQPPYPRIDGLFDNGPTNQWGNYVEAVTSKMVPLGVTYFETWNEPDLQWWDGKDAADPERTASPPTDTAAFINDYVQMVQTTLDRAAPGSSIILGAPQSPGDSAAEAWADVAWEAVNAQPTLANQLRAAAIHSYEWPFRTWTLADHVRGIFSSRPDIPIWVTESGLHKFESGDALYEPRQAAYVFQQAAYARLAGAEVNFHFALHDVVENNIVQLGLEHGSGTAANVFQFVTPYLRTAQINQDLSILPAGSADTDFYSFVADNPYTRLVFDDSANNRRITLVWANQTGDSIPATLPRQSDSCAQLFDQEGNDRTSELETSGGAYQVTLGPADDSSVNIKIIGLQQVPLVGGPGYMLVETSGGCPESYIPAIDVVVVMDTTGSMGSAIYGAKQVAINYIDDLANQGIDYRAAVVEYKDKRYDPYASRLDLNFTTDQTAIFNAINALSAYGGGDIPEDVYSGLITAINLSWRDGAKKVILLMGDAGPNDPEPGTGYTLSSVVNAANAVDPASIYAIRVGSNGYMRSAFQQLADGTGGVTFDTNYSSTNVITAILSALTAIARSPSAVIGVFNEPVLGSVGTPIHFDGSHSFDPDGFIVQYEWDFNNDGIFDVSMLGSGVHYTYTQAYNGKVTLRVTDNHGYTGQVKVSANVGFTGDDTTPPVITITSPLPQTYLHTDSLSIAWTATDSGSGVASSTGTLDGSIVTNGQTVDLFLFSLGVHTLEVSATDKAGNTATASVNFTVVADIDSLIALEQRACELGWIEGKGVCNSLESKLLVAKDTIDRGRFNAARNQLNAFVAELDALNEKKVTQGYDILKADTLYVIDSLP